MTFYDHASWLRGEGVSSPRARYSWPLHKSDSTPWPRGAITCVEAWGSHGLDCSLPLFRPAHREPSPLVRRHLICCRPGKAPVGRDCDPAPRSRDCVSPRGTLL